MSRASANHAYKNAPERHRRGVDGGSVCEVGNTPRRTKYPPQLAKKSAWPVPKAPVAPKFSVAALVRSAPIEISSESSNSWDVSYETSEDSSEYMPNSSDVD